MTITYWILFVAVLLLLSLVFCFSFWAKIFCGLITRHKLIDSWARYDLDLSGLMCLCGYKRATFVDIKCPLCHHPHVDIGKWRTRPHHNHLCHTCGNIFDVPTNATDKSHQYTIGIPWMTAKR